jgi:hypothetical protein
LAAVLAAAVDFDPAAVSALVALPLGAVPVLVFAFPIALVAAGDFAFSRAFASDNPFFAVSRPSLCLLHRLRGLTYRGEPASLVSWLVGIKFVRRE